MQKDDIVLVYDVGTKRACISLSLSSPKGEEYHDWGSEVESVTAIDAQRAAQAAGIPVTHRSVATREGRVGYPIRI